MAENELVVVQGHDHPLLLRSSLQGLDASWVLDAPAAGTAHSAKTRYRQADSACTVARVEDGAIAVDFPNRTGQSRLASPWCSTTARSVWAGGSRSIA